MPRAAMPPILSLLRPRHAQGFSLPELLVAVALSSLTVVVAVQILGPHLRMNQRMEGYTRLQERWARIAYLLDTEIPKARTINAVGSTLTLEVPVPNLSFNAETCDQTPPIPLGEKSVIKTIVYKLDNTQTKLLRDGPAINCWGRLSQTTTTSNVVIVDGIAPGSFSPSVNTNSVNYTLSLTDPNSDATFNGRGSAARGRADCLSLEADATLPPEICD